MRSRRGFGASAALCLSLLASGPLLPIPALAAADLTIGANTSSWSDNSGGFPSVHIVGEVTNNSAGNYVDVQVKCDLLDHSGALLGTDTEPTRARILQPGETSPFEDLFPNQGAFDHFACSTWGGPTTRQPNHRFTSAVTSVGIDPLSGNQHVAGTVKNLNSVPASDVAVIITSYDPTSGAVVDQLTATVPGPIAAQATTTFDVIPINDRPWDGPYAFITEAASPAVSLSETAINFPDQVQGTTSGEQTLYVNNVGTADLHLGQVGRSGQNLSEFSIPGLDDHCSGVTVAAGGACMLGITFTPQASGARNATLLVNDDANGAPQSVALAGNGLRRPMISLSSTSIPFGSQTAGTSTTITVQVTSNGLDAVTISSVQLDNTADFGVDPGSCLSSSMAPGTACSVTVTFHPSHDGDLAGTITITHDGRNSPRTIVLSGTGLHAVPGAVLSPDHLTFEGQLLHAASTPRTVSLSNTGTGPMSIAGIATTNPDFGQTNNCPVTLDAGSSCSISVTFTPSAVGDRAGSLRVTDDAGSGVQAIPLTGTGITQTDFYFAEGFTGAGFRESLSLLMPNHDGTATIDYYLRDGVHRTGLVDLIAGKVAIVDVNQAVGRDQDVSVRVRFPFPGVAERIMHFNSGSWLGSTDIVGVTQPASEWDFAEGSTLPFFSEYLTLQNPNDTPVTVDLRYFGDDGTHPVKTMVLPATSRTTVSVPDDPRFGVGRGIGGVSVQVVARGGASIIVERPFYVNGFSFGSGAIRDGHVAFGANAPATTWNFAEGTTLRGFNEYLTLENPQALPASVSLRYIDTSGNVALRSVIVGAQSRATVEVFNPAQGVGVGAPGVSVQVTADRPIVAERPMYMVHDFGTGPVAGAHVVMGSNSLGTLFGFASASTAAGENDFLTIQNPNPAAAHLTVTYYTSSGPVSKTVLVGASTRHTLQMFLDDGEGIGPGQSLFGVAVQSDQPILVEKPTYSSKAATYGATDTLGYSPPEF